jgi:hypothetical protein
VLPIWFHTFSEYIVNISAYVDSGIGFADHSYLTEIQDIMVSRNIPRSLVTYDLRNIIIKKSKFYQRFYNILKDFS